jgi:ATP-binding cassette subfamily B protein
MLAYRALGHLIEGGRRLSSALIAWQRIRSLIKACQRYEPAGRSQAKLMKRVDRPIVTARDVEFRYRGRSQPVLHNVDLSICAGERVLLQGSSGGGKSTLASLLAGSRVADSGLLLLHGLDRETLGAANWRRRVVLSPQFHENHMLMGPLMFNLLMGRRWPPAPADLEEAERICRGLGLGPLLDRMPGGMNQMVGETGWQLSHGEKSRVYIARALLQGADLTILDESFGALDPQNLQLTLKFVLDETSTLLVIAHP